MAAAWHDDPAKARSRAVDVYGNSPCCIGTSCEHKLLRLAGGPGGLLEGPAANVMMDYAPHIQLLMADVEREHRQVKYIPCNFGATAPLTLDQIAVKSGIRQLMQELRRRGFGLPSSLSSKLLQSSAVDTRKRRQDKFAARYDSRRGSQPLGLKVWTMFTSPKLQVWSSTLLLLPTSDSRRERSTASQRRRAKREHGAVLIENRKRNLIELTRMGTVVFVSMLSLPEIADRNKHAGC